MHSKAKKSIFFSENVEIKIAKHKKLLYKYFEKTTKINRINYEFLILNVTTQIKPFC